MTTVRFPTRVVLTVADDRLDDDLVALAVDAADAALTRAVRRAAGLDLVRTSRAEPGDLRCQVQLVGDELPESVAVALRRGLGALVTARAAALAAVPTPRRVTDGGGSEPVAERYDHDRLVLDPHAPVDDAYLVASYDDAGAPVAVPVAGSAHDDTQARAGTVRRVEMRLVDITSRADLERRIRDLYGDTTPDYFVAVYRDAGRPLMVLLHCSPDGTILGHAVMGGVVVYVPPSGEGEGHWQGTSILDAEEITYVGQAVTDDERLEARTIAWMQHLRAGGSAEGVAEADLRRQAAALARTMPRRTGATSYYAVAGADGVPEIMEVDQARLFRGTLPVAVFVEGVTVDVPQDDERDRARGELPLDELLLGFEPDPAHPFLAEPPVEYWPAGISSRLSRLIGQIAATLAMPAGRFPGMFLLAALGRVGRLARGAGALVGTGGDEESPRLARLRTIVTAYAPIGELELLYSAVIAGGDEGGTAPAPIRGNSASWLLHFYEEFFSRRDGSVRDLFVAECQDQLLDVLERSHRELLQRQRNLTAYLKVTRALILLLLVDDVELSDLRRRLVERIEDDRRDQVVAVLAGGAPIDRWWSSTSVVLGSMGHVDAGPVPTAGRGALRQTADGWQVQDSVGRWWSRGELESVISGGRQEAYAVDPFLEKLADLDDVIERMRTAGAAGLQDEFARLLEELRSENEAKTRDVRADLDIAFGMATFTEAPRTDLGAQLSGIHELADQALRPLFTGGTVEVYEIGMRALVGTELGKAAFMEFFNLVGLVAIAIVCPELAFVIGAVEAVDAVDTAIEHRQIQRAMLGGDAIITHAQAEAELWGAAIGAALIFVPEVPGLLRGTARGLTAVVRGEARGAARAAGREIAETAAKRIAELAARDLVVTFARECLQGYLLNLVINAAISRFAQTIAREVEVTGHASLGDITRLVGDAIAGPAQVTPDPAPTGPSAAGGGGGITAVTP